MHAKMSCFTVLGASPRVTGLKFGSVNQQVRNRGINPRLRRRYVVHLYDRVTCMLRLLWLPWSMCLVPPPVPITMADSLAGLPVVVTSPISMPTRWFDIAD